MFPTPPFPFAGLLPALASVPNYHSNPIAQRLRRKRQRLPPSLLIENASDVFLAFQRTACPRRFRSRLATTRPQPHLSLPTIACRAKSESNAGLAARHTLIATEFGFWRRGRTSSGIRCPSDVLL